jgi:hypothetical protein
MNAPQEGVTTTRPSSASTAVASRLCAGSQVLVPQRIDPGRRSSEMSNAQVNARQAGALHRGSAEFRAVIADLAPSQRDPLTRLADWADTLEREGLVRLATYRAKGGQMTTLLPRLAADDAGLVTIYCDGGSAYLQFWRSVFERRAPHSIPAVEAATGQEIRQGNTIREIRDSLLTALTSAYREAVGVAAPRSSYQRPGD